ncbi:hypothetical protein E1258_18165 [Micromonospora sp. KC207]|uniref:hypothetical protein n=1 Tax=Micromonospora sp. KC207 TaxID=2530377 RepID=UPI00104B7AE8|nr:hypothetical protein [Micromonospora sp. KC207]TDC59384.1 hypothetical protein E1258_18165 [Micromonospora sp. KC207]
MGFIAGCQDVSPAPSLDAPTEDRFAWISAGEITVRAGDRTVGPIVGGFQQAGNVFWTASGTYAGAVSIDADGLGSVVAIDARSGDLRRIPCGCSRVEPIGDDRVAYVDGRNQGRTLDLAGAAEPVAFDLKLPADARATQIMAAAGETVLVRTVLPSADDGSGDDTIFLVGPDGPAREVHRHASIVGSRAVGGHDADGRPVFLISQPADDGICPDEHAWILRTGHGLARLDLTIGPGSTSMGDSWWDREGRLNSILSTVVCEGPDSAPPTWWRWADGNWTQVENRPVTAVRLLTSGDRAEIAPEDDIPVLFRRHGDARSQIATEVLAVAAPPAQPRSLVRATGQPLSEIPSGR